MQKRIYEVIGVASCWGAQIRTCEDGPDALKAAGCLEALKEHHIRVNGWDTIYPPVCFKDKDIPLKDALPLISELNRSLADKVIQVMERGHFPVVIGGDHSVAVGTWNGVGTFLSRQTDKPLGMIWIDAHMDSHTPETTPSGAWHGMPLSALIGYGVKDLAETKRKAPIFLPQNVCLIGVRSFEQGEQELLEDLNVRIYYIEEVKRRGFDTVLQEAACHVSKETIGYGVSLDIDVVDPLDAPGAGSAEPGGLFAEELLNGLSLFNNDPRLKAFELVEFNPHLDIDGRTAQLCRKILLTALLRIR